MKLFKPEDFEVLDVFGIVDMSVVSDIANAKLEEWLKDAPTVYVHSASPKELKPSLTHGYGWGMEPQSTDTHKAKLVDIQEIK